MPHQPQVALFDVAQPPMHHFRRLRRRARCEIVLLDDSHAVPAQAGIQRRIRAGNPAAHDKHVVLLTAQPVQLLLPHQT
ncbi:hypothetical protein G6F40_018206 [Rhizopus arrhizus]|nr:hypothetical protein G6F40_018206 [Rhizopus arrhizus]